MQSKLFFSLSLSLVRFHTITGPPQGKGYRYGVKGGFQRGKDKLSSHCCFFALSLPFFPQQQNDKRRSSAHGVLVKAQWQWRLSMRTRLTQKREAWKEGCKRSGEQWKSWSVRGGGALIFCACRMIAHFLRSICQSETGLLVFGNAAGCSTLSVLRFFFPPFFTPCAAFLVTRGAVSAAQQRFFLQLQQPFFCSRSPRFVYKIFKHMRKPNFCNHRSKTVRYVLRFCNRKGGAVGRGEGTVKG